MPLTSLQRTQTVGVLRMASDAYVSLPLWEFHPYLRPYVLSERGRRSLLQHDPEPIGDSEYS